jgi:hypothetical protein
MQTQRECRKRTKNACLRTFDGYGLVVSVAAEARYPIFARRASLNTWGKKQHSRERHITHEIGTNGSSCLVVLRTGSQAGATTFEKIAALP